jgi:hypothetical protein
MDDPRRETMTDYRVIAISEATADTVRATLASPQYGHPAHVEVAGGYGPCRLCLHTFAVGEERRILFTYDPFEETGGPPLPGPVFIHESQCPRFPEHGGFPGDLRVHALTLCAYGPERRLLAEECVADGDVEAVIGRLLADPAVAYLHVRDTQAGCFDLRIEREADLGRVHGNQGAAP